MTVGLLQRPPATLLSGAHAQALYNQLADESDPVRINALQDLIRREHAISSPVAMAVHCTAGLAEPYIPYRWVKLLNSHLVALAERRIEFLMIEVPVRHGKSELCSVWFPSWYLGHNPDHKIILAGHSERFASKFGRRVRNILRQWGPVLFDITISGERYAAKDWNFGGGFKGGMVATGVGNPPTGEGGNAIVLDDPVRTRKQAFSPTHRESTYEWWREDIRSRLEPGGIGLMVMSRRHEDDLSGRIKRTELEARGDIEAGARDKWVILRLPGRAEPNDPLGRAVGDALCPERYDNDALTRLERAMGKTAFAALIQNSPAPAEGTMFKVEDWRYATAPPAGLDLVLWWDLAATADGEGDPDWTAWVLAGRDPSGMLWIVEAGRFRAEPARREKRMRMVAESMHARHGCTKVRFPQDPGSEGKVSKRHLVANVFGGLPVNSKGFPMKGSKEARADPYSGQQGANNVVLIVGAWNEDFVAEHRDFPNGGHDDQVDAAAMAVQELMGLLGGRTEIIV